MGFRALVAPAAGVPCEERTLELDDLPAGDVVVAVARSSHNYKDSLAVTGRGKILRRFPIVPGIDLAGTVLESRSPVFQPGERVLATGFGIGEHHSGGYAERARLSADWLVPLPSSVTFDVAMALGTAGLTAMLAVLAIEENGVRASDERPVLVTGAGGGVGSLAVMLLALAGHRVAAATGRPSLEASLRRSGAGAVVPRAELEAAARPLESQRWSAVVDTVGGPILARAIAETALHGVVAACGLAASSGLQTTVMPFILRGVRLIGIDSNWCPMARRRDAWARLARELTARELDPITRHVPLADVPEVAEEILAGQIHGRVVVDIA